MLVAPKGANECCLLLAKGVGDEQRSRTERIKKPWAIKKAGGKETLLIVFNAKNYDSNKWGEITYEFTTCQ